MECPKCNGPVWDNRPKKADGSMKATAPDLSCKDKENCGWKQWPPKNGQGPNRGAAPNVPAKAPRLSWKELGNTYAKCASIAKAVWEKNNLSSEAIVAATATIFIQTMQAGLIVRDAPPPPPPKPVPVAVPDGEDYLPPDYDEAPY